MSRPSHPGPRSGQAGLDQAVACDVFYLRIEPYRGGFRWLVAKSGMPDAVVADTAVFPTDYAAKVAGRAGLDRLLAHQNSWTQTYQPS